MFTWQAGSIGKFLCGSYGASPGGGEPEARGDPHFPPAPDGPAPPGLSSGTFLVTKVHPVHVCTFHLSMCSGDHRALYRQTDRVVPSLQDRTASWGCGPRAGAPGLGIGDITALVARRAASSVGRASVSPHPALLLAGRPTACPTRHQVAPVSLSVTGTQKVTECRRRAGGGQVPLTPACQQPVLRKQLLSSCISMRVSASVSYCLPLSCTCAHHPFSLVMVAMF